MPYEVICPEGTSVSMLINRGNLTDFDGKVYGYDHVTENFDHGAIIPDDELSPVVVKAYDDGDEHVKSLLKRVSDSKPGPKAKQPHTKPEVLDPDDSPLRAQAERNPTARSN